MNRSCTSSINKDSVQCSAFSVQSLAGSVALAMLILMGTEPAAAQQAGSFEREPLTMRVVAVNPSAEKSQAVPVRIDLPMEIGPNEILDQGDLEVDFDTARSQYFVKRDDIILAPKETRIFEIIMKDVWFIPAVTLDGLSRHTELVLSRLEPTEYYDTAKVLAKTVLDRLDAMRVVQSDDSISRRKRIGAYRRNMQELKVIKEDLLRMEKLLSFTGGVPVPEMLEESPLKSDAPSRTTTWLVIFLIIIFMGLLAGQFFMTWQRRLKSVTDFTDQSQEAFPDDEAQKAAAGTEAESGGEQP